MEIDEKIIENACNSVKFNYSDNIGDYAKKVAQKVIDLTIEDLRKEKSAAVDAAYRRGCEDTKYIMDLESNDEIIPFNLESYREGMRVRTRDGRDVRILCTDAHVRPIVALVKNEDGDELIKQYYSDGKISSRDEKPEDLMIIGVKECGFVNIYKADDGECIIGSQTIYKTEEDAYKIGGGHLGGAGGGKRYKYIDTIKIRWSE
jgi:hypothetical protein